MQQIKPNIKYKPLAGKYCLDIIKCTYFKRLYPMSADYYKILQVSNTASTSEIKQAYLQLTEKWKKLRVNQTPEMRTRTDKILTIIEEAYQVLSIEETRLIYDQERNQTTQTASSTVELPNEIEKKQPTTSTKKPLSRFSLFLVLVLIIVGASAYYIFFVPNNLFTSSQDDTALEPAPRYTKQTTELKASLQENKPAQMEQPKQPKPKEIIIPAPQPKTEKVANNTTPVAIQKNDVKQTFATPTPIDAERLKNANDPSLKETAKGLAKITNAHKAVVINFNTQFIEANASNQNITLKFMVIDGISTSRALLDTYLTERFFFDNQLCDVQKANIAKGITFTFTYYNTQNELIGKYYIDQQVCESPMEKRLIKTPDQYQIDSIEIDEDGKPIANKEENQASETPKDIVN